MSASRLAAPDAGLISFGEMVDQGRMINAAVKFPVIGDADTGYGNALNVKRTVQGYIQAGFAGLLLEDQVHCESVVIIFDWHQFIRRVKNLLPRLTTRSCRDFDLLCLGHRCRDTRTMLAINFSRG